MAMTRRLALVIHGLSGGGAERVLTDMANYWADQGHHVTLITLAAVNTDVYQVDEPVQRVALDLMRESHGPVRATVNNLRRVLALRSALRAVRPDFVISFTDQINVLTLVASLGTRFRVIVCDRVDPRYHPLGRAWSLLRRCFYRRCFAAVVQTDAVREFVQPLVQAKPVYKLPNAVGADVAQLQTARPAGDSRNDTAESPHRLIAMGRLVRQKGFDLLIDAFALVAERHSNWTLDIYGTGPARDELQQQIERHALAQRVHLAGWTDDRFGELARADLFVLSSRYEGFPNVLLDAMASGLAVVSFDCPSGPREIIRSDVDGDLVPAENVDALGDALDGLMRDAALRARLASRAGEVLERFSIARFYGRWEAIFDGASPDSACFESADTTESA